MTPEQKKRAAELIYPAMSAEICGERIFFDDCWDDRWHPSFTGDLHQRSQALAVVEWLIANHKTTDQLQAIAVHICNQDIESLLSLVLELSDE